MKADTLYSIIIHVFNGEESIAQVCQKIDSVFKSLQNKYEVVLINDCSCDNSWRILQQLNQDNPHIKIINLMRNFGEHNAVIAGLNHCSGDFAVIMDDDGQTPPDELPKLINKIREGYDVVFAKYPAKKHSLLRNIGSKINDLAASLLLKKPKNLYLCSFKIINRALIDEIIKYSGPYPYIDGLIFRSTRNIGVVEVEHKERKQGKSGYTFKKLFSLWLNMFTNFSILPLRIATLMGLFFALVGFVFAIFFVVDKLLNPETPLGWASLIVTVIFFAGIQLVVLGMIGEYLGRLFLSVNKTPQFIISELRGFD